MIDKVYITNSDAQTEQVGKELAKAITKGDNILLYGDLGGGKTTLTKGLAKGLGITSRIVSPTFVLERSHVFADKGLLRHFDLYRIEGEKELLHAGVIDALSDKKAVTVIEWAEKLTAHLPKEYNKIKFENLGENKRKITVTKVFRE